MDHKHSCVVDADGFYQNLVLQLLATLPEGGEVWQPQCYTIAAGERLVDVPMPDLRSHAGEGGLVRPRLNPEETGWVEGATEEEIAAWAREHPAPAPPPPTALDKLQEENRLLAARVAALSEQNDFQEDLIVELAGVVYA